MSHADKLLEIVERERTRLATVEARQAQLARMRAETRQVLESADETIARSKRLLVKLKARWGPPPLHG